MARDGWDVAVHYADVAQAAVYLANAGAVSGTILLVDGGQHLVPSSRDVMFATEPQLDQDGGKQ